METGRARSRGPAAWSLRRAERPPTPSGARLVRTRQTEQAHIVTGTNGLSRSDPDRFGRASSFSNIDCSRSPDTPDQLIEQVDVSLLRGD